MGNTAFCGEALGGLDWTFVPRWHLSAEGGVGIDGKNTSGYPDLGVAQESGGFYGVVRLMGGYDVTPQYYVRVGVQGKGTYLLNWFTPGGQFVVDIGTRLLNHRLEVAFRMVAGADGVATGGMGGNSQATLVAAYGAALAFRYVFR